MHITLDTQKLKNTLDVAARVSTKHITLPILQCVLLIVKKNTLTVRATNLEIGVEGTVVGENGEDGSVAVPALTLLNTISLIQHKTTSLVTDADVLHIETTSSKTDIKTMEAGDFPSIPEIKENPQSLYG